MDTVCVDVMGHLRPDIVKALSDRMFCKLDQWELREKLSPNYMGNRSRSFTAARMKPHCFVHGKDGMIERARFQLPTILHGFNGIQIKNQFELDLAVLKTISIIGEIAESPVQFGIFHRVDFAFNLPCNPREILHELFTVRHPKIRAGATRYQSNGVQFYGEKYTLSAYIKEHCTKKGTFPKPKEPSPQNRSIRLEIQAKTKKAVAEMYNGNNILTRELPSFPQLWSSFRGFLDKLSVPRTVLGEVTMPMLLAICELNHYVLPDGRTPLEMWKRNKKPDTIRKEMKKIRAFTYALGGIPLIDRIPVEPPLIFLDVHQDRSSHLVEAPSINPPVPVPAACLSSEG